MEMKSKQQVIEKPIRSKRKIIKISLVSLIMLCSLTGSVYFRYRAEKTYERALEEYSQKDYNAALEDFKLLGNFRDSVTYIEKTEKYILYLNAIACFEEEKYEEAYNMFIELNGFEDSDKWILKSKYYYGIKLFDSGEYDLAAKIFIELGNYADSQKYAAKSLLPSIDNVQETVYIEATDLYKEGKYKEALADYLQLQDYLDSKEMVEECQEQIMRRRLATSISAGIKYSLAVKQGETVVGTAFNVDGQTNVDEWKNIISVAGFGVLSAGLKSDGTVVVCGHVDGDIIDVTEWENIVQIQVGERHIIGLAYDGTVKSDGHNGDGQCEVDGWKDVVQVATGWRHTVGLTKEGEILITGYGAQRQLREIDTNEWKTVIAIAAGGGGKDVEGNGHTVGLRTDGTVVAVGDNQFGQCNVSEWTDIVAIAAGDWHTVGLKADGTVVATGWLKDTSSENACNVSEWKNIVAIAAGTGYTMGLKEDGTIVVVGYNEGMQQEEILKWNDIAIYSEWNNDDS